MALLIESTERKSMKVKLAVAFIITLFLSSPALAESTTRIKDIAFVRGARSNQLVGYGLVAGLNGTGDGRRIPFTRQTLGNMVNQFGVSFDIAQLRSEDVAAVMVIADLPAYAKEGTRLDALVSAIGDADSLQGGTLLMTPLRAGDNKIYAVAQGPVSIGGFDVRRRVGQTRHQTAGLVVQGVLVENEVPSTIISDEKYVNIYLRRADFTTAARSADAINLRFHEIVAQALDGSTIKVQIPPKYTNDRITFISEVELTTVQPDIRAKVVINERTGTVVVGKDVIISPVAISHGDIRIVVGGAEKETQPKTPIEAEVEGHVVQIGGANVGEVVNALNAIGVLPQDMIAIFEAIELAGALQATLEFM